MAYVIVDIEARAHGGEEMVLPSRKRASSLKVGWHVKLRFEESPNTRKPAIWEHLWVRVESPLDDNDRYEGLVVDKPVFLHDVKHGERVSFEPKNVVDFVDG